MLLPLTLKSESIGELGRQAGSKFCGHKQSAMRILAKKTVLSQLRDSSSVVRTR